MELFQSAWAQGGALGILLLVVVLVCTGRLVPRSVAKAWVDLAKTNAEIHQAAAAAADARADTAVNAMVEQTAAMREMQGVMRTINDRLGTPPVPPPGWMPASAGGP